MAILWFGSAKTLDDLKTNDLRKERQRLEVQLDQLRSRMRRAQGEWEGLAAAAARLDPSDVDIKISGAKMGEAEIRKVQAESDSQEVSKKLRALDVYIGILDRKSELQKSGVWKTLGEIDPDTLTQQVTDSAVERKEGVDILDQVIEMTQIDTLSVEASQPSEQRRAIEEINRRRAAQQGTE